MAFLVRMQSDAHSHGSKPSTANHVSITWHCGIRNKSYANDMLAKIDKLVGRSQDLFLPAHACYTARLCKQHTQNSSARVAGSR